MFAKFRDTLTLMLIQAHDPEVARASRLLKLGIVLLLLAGSPLLAQQLPSATENVIVRTAIFVTQVAFYGLGGLAVIWALIIAVGKNIFKSARFQEHSAFAPIAWSLVLFAAPSLLKLALDWFNNQEGSEGALDSVITDINLGGN